ncbi:MAG: sensor histidine kinase [Paraclostridium sp.]
MGYIETLNIKKGSKFDLKKIFADISNINDIEEKVTKEGSYTADIYDNHTDSIVDLSITVFEINNKKYKVIIIKDISEKYKLEKVLLECEMIKQEDIMKNEFFSNISHELKTPLNIIYSANQLLDASINKDNFKDTYIKYSSCMNINCKRMLRLIDNIVDMTKLDIGFKSPNFENYDIVKTVEDMTLSVVSYAKVKGIELIFDTQIEELNIKCDIDMLERIILNLLSNSIKFSEQGGYILVEVFNNKDWVCIKIKDDGIGIPFDIQPKIFDRFVQGDKSIRRQKEGSGIGLSLVKSFVDLMEGEIYLESDGKKGTEVTVLLPNKLFIGDKCTLNQDYEVNIQRVQLELSDIYELYGNYD